MADFYGIAFFAPPSAHADALNGRRGAVAVAQLARRQTRSCHAHEGNTKVEGEAARISIGAVGAVGVAGVVGVVGVVGRQESQER